MEAVVGGHALGTAVAVHLCAVGHSRQYAATVGHRHTDTHTHTPTETERDTYQQRVRGHLSEELQLFVRDVRLHRDPVLYRHTRVSTMHAVGPHPSQYHQIVPTFRVSTLS
eukprot:3716407-Rhodomonas_salina.2